MFQLMESATPNAVIKVIGVGGGGGNAINHMLGGNIEGVEFVCANTDAQALKRADGITLLQLGTNVTKGLGAGANPEVRPPGGDRGPRAHQRGAARRRHGVHHRRHGAGGTGTGAAPVIAQIAKDLDILTVAVVTKPFPFEGKRRMAVAQKGIEELAQHVDSLITIPNEKLLTVLGREVSLLNAFREANDVLLGAVQGIADLITRPGLINVDFADVRTVMSEMGLAMMGTGKARGDDRAVAATEAAIGNPLLEDINLKGACGILVNITAGPNLTMREYHEVGQTVAEFAADDANIKIGTVLDMDLEDEIRVTVVATGLNRAAQRNPVDVYASAPTRGNFRVVRPELDVVAPPAPVAHPQPTQRPQQVRSFRGAPAAAAAPAAAQENEYDYLDIPAFLRRQAD